MKIKNTVRLYKKGAMSENQFVKFSKIWINKAKTIELRQMRKDCIFRIIMKNKSL